MNIILLCASKRISLPLAPLACFGLLAVFIVIGFIIYQAGYAQASRQSADIAQAARAQTEAAWQAGLEHQLNGVRTAKRRAEKSLDAMAGRLSLLQGHVMRLDALGARLAAMADLEEIDFAIESPPGMGGPGVDNLDMEGLSMNGSGIDRLGPGAARPQQLDFIESLGFLEEALLDRQDKLLAMESMLIDRNLQERTLPTGMPAEDGWVSSLYGYRADPLTGNREFHQGVDYAGKLGTAIIAVAAGIVTWSGERYGYGKLVEISHGNGLVTRYAHNAENLVTVGEKIEQGEVIALMGDSGRSTGTHVHFEVLKDGRHINPKQYLSLR